MCARSSSLCSSWWVLEALMGLVSPDAPSALTPLSVRNTLTHVNTTQRALLKAKLYVKMAFQCSV